jgi:hypothetical protein
MKKNERKKKCEKVKYRLNCIHVLFGAVSKIPQQWLILRNKSRFLFRSLLPER